MNQRHINLKFIEACWDRSLEGVKYALTSPDISIHAQVHFNDDEPLIAVCQTSAMDIIKYLTTSPELTEHANIYAQNCYGFLFCCDVGNIEVVNFLLYELKIKISPELAYTLDREAGDYALSNIFEIIEKRDSYFKLQNTLGIKGSDNNLKLKL